jgi:succinate dehydrogenase / fumarate reductase membrane anchor subunit
LALTAARERTDAMAGQPSIRTPFSRIRFLGSAKSGTEHFWMQRLTGIANIVTAIGLVVIVLMLRGKSYGDAIAILSHPLASLILLAGVISASIHMRIGMQVVIEDYVHAEGLKVLALLANTFFAFAIGLSGAYAILKIGLAKLV